MPKWGTVGAESYNSNDCFAPVSRVQTATE